MGWETGPQHEHDPRTASSGRQHQHDGPRVRTSRAVERARLTEPENQP